MNIHFAYTLQYL